MDYRDLRRRGITARSSERRSDPIAREIALCFEWSIRVPQDRIVVEVQNGWVTLTGVVDWRYQKLAAETCLGGIAGIRGITNLIRVRPHAEDADVRQKMIDLACTWQHGVGPAPVRMR